MKSLQILFLCAVAAAGAEPGEIPQRAPSLVENGDFETADADEPGRPAGWAVPDGLGVQWTSAPAGSDGAPRGKAIRLDTRVSEKDMVASWKAKGITEWDIPSPAESPVAGTYGLSYYSQPISIETGVTYRVEFDYMGPPGGAKVWVRCYGLLNDRMRRRYETIVKCGGAKDEWTEFSKDFCPTRLRPEVTEMKVMLYAYWPPGVYWFDNVRITALPGRQEGE
jgi:hypothetical protein